MMTTKKIPTHADASAMLLELATGAEASGEAYAARKLREKAAAPEEFLQGLQGEFLASQMQSTTH